jgi:hypothetical protein
MEQSFVERQILAIKDDLTLKRVQVGSATVAMTNLSFE